MDLWRALEADWLGEPRYVRFQPGRRLVVMYDSMAHLTVLKPKRTERLWEKVAGSPLASRVPELGGVLQRFPLDVRLPGLPEAAQGGELIRYKPGRRALFRYDGAYGKVRADRRAPVTIPGTPRVLEHRPEVGPDGLRGGAGDATARAPISSRGWRRSPRRWRGCTPRASTCPCTTWQPRRATCGRRPRRRPRSAPTPGDLAERLLARLADVPPATATIHGSFHDDQVLVGDEGVTLLDLDSAAIGHPLLDVGHFASYLTAAGRGRGARALPRGLRRGPRRAAVRGRRAAALEQPAVPRPRAGLARTRCARRVELARERLADYRRSASSVITAS